VPGTPAADGFRAAACPLTYEGIAWSAGVPTNNPGAWCAWGAMDVKVLLRSGSNVLGERARLFDGASGQPQAVEQSDRAGPARTPGRPGDAAVARRAQ
jgi:hypothetical protein